MAVLVPVAPYEVCCLFPVNGRVREIGVEIEKRRGKADEKEVKRELGELFGKWKVRNWGRVGLPVVAGVVGWLGVV